MLKGNVFLVDALSISLGAIFGAWLRFKIIGFWQKIFIDKRWGIFLVNIWASFGLGLLMALINDNKNISTSLAKLLLIGFLGSLSTFSSFVFDLFQTLIAKQYKHFLLVSFFSISGGLLAAFTGYSLIGR